MVGETGLLGLVKTLMAIRSSARTFRGTAGALVETLMAREFCHVPDADCPVLK
ncbi:amidotransferase [Bacillus sp. OxB-1]|nr:amidotransferase [Bacillus sp. OxB-1]